MGSECLAASGTVRLTWLKIRELEAAGSISNEATDQGKQFSQAAQYSKFSEALVHFSGCWLC
jgi:hypothetical protein